MQQVVDQMRHALVEEECELRAFTLPRRELVAGNSCDASVRALQRNWACASSYAGTASPATSLGCLAQ